MITLIDQHYFGNIAYWSLIQASTSILLEAHENYQKRSFRNKLELLSAQGKVYLTIPLQKGKHNQQPIKEVRIAYHEPWSTVHLRTIETCYSSAPFYAHYQSDIKELFMTNLHFLWDFNHLCILWVKKQLGIQKDFEITSTYHHAAPPGVTDLRGVIKPDGPISHFKPAVYAQVFEDRLGFSANLCILDLLFCYGPDAKHILNQSLWRL